MKRKAAPGSALDGITGLSAFERRVALVGVLCVAVLVAVCVLWPRAPWSLTLAADEADVTPWESVELDAKIQPAEAPSKPISWTWTVAGKPVESVGSHLEWRGGEPGAYVIEATATAANGVVHRAFVTVRVTLRDYLTAQGATVHAEPDVEPKKDGPGKLPFSIADIWVEKSEICQGEATRIRVTAADDRGKAAWLVPIINGVQAWEADYTGPISGPGLRRVPVLLSEIKPGATRPDIVAESVYIDVKDCVAAYPLFVEGKMIPPDANYRAFTAHIFDGPKWTDWMHRGRLGDDGKPAPVPFARAAAYVWDFGDGARETSSEPRMNHRYPEEGQRPAGRRAAYLAKLEAFAVDGKKMGTGYLPVLIDNATGTMLEDYRILQLITRVPPGPAGESPEGSRTVHVSAENVDATETARVDSLRAKFVPCDGGAPTEEPLAVGRVFSNPTVPPHGTIEGQYTATKQELGGACSVAIELDGVTTPGNAKVSGAFALVTGNAAGHPASDEQEQVLARVHALLGDASVISADSIHRLEDEGKIPRGVLMPDPFARGAPPHPP